MKMITLTAICMLSSLSAFAAGSISRATALAEVAAESPPLASALGRLGLAGQGSAIRAGNHTGEGGKRLMPYTFLTEDKKLTVEIGRDEIGMIWVSIQQTEK